MNLKAKDTVCPVIALAAAFSKSIKNPTKITKLKKKSIN